MLFSLLSLIIKIESKEKDMRNINRKGFTLIELLAVIVILAIIMFIATPAVINVMEQSQSAAFKNEVNEVKTIFETAFNKERLKNSDEIQNITIGSTDYRYMCKTLADLAKDGDTEKPYDKNTNYKGKYEVFVPIDGSSPAMYFIHFTNKQFTVRGLYYSTTSSDAYKPKGAVEVDGNFNSCVDPSVAYGKDKLPVEIE